jgi:DNA repair protein RecN (Recombination protein N)
MDLLSFQAGEILGARLRPGEDAELESERRRLSNAESLLTLAQTVTGILHDGDGELPAALDTVGDAVGKLEKLARIDPDMAATAAEAESLHEQLRDLVRSVQDYADGLEFNPERLAEVEERVELIAAFRRKYGDSVEQINAFGVRAQAELEELSGREARTGALEKEEERLLRTIGALAAALSAQRRRAGETLARHVEQELADLRMNRARIAVAVEQESQPGGVYWPDGRRVACDLTGADKVEFLISANVGEPLKPMARVASGGETARLMLALKSTLANADATPTLIFDEIDQGIGGRVGAIVGQKLWRLTGQLPATAAGEGALPHQVLCITHLPQLAVFGDDHLTVNKQVRTIDGQERTTTVVRLLSGDERTAELMSMLGASSEAGRRSVEEMLAEVAAVKRGVRLMS